MNQRDAIDPGLDAESSNEPQTMSLLGGVAGADRPGPETLADDEPTPGGSFTSGPLVLVFLVVVAAAALWLMRPGKDSLASDGVSKQAEATVTQILAKLGNPDAMAPDDPLRPENQQALFQDTDEIIDMLSQDYANRQVPVEYVKKNPFAMAIKPPDPAAPVRNVDHRAREMRIKQLQAELGRLQLQTVMNGRGAPIAVIGGEFYQPGQTVGSFTIESIDTTTLTVCFTAENQRFKLSMDK